MKIRNIFLSLLATTFVSSAAMADTIKGVYVNAEAGAILSQTQHSSISGSSSQVGSSPGFGGEASVGYGFGNGLRAEIEGDFYQVHINRVSPENAHGHNRQFGGFVNVLYDIDLDRHFGINVPVTPYIGAGVGYGVNQYDVSSPVRNISGTQGTFQYQGIVGARFNTPVKNLYANVDYRMIGQTMGKDSFSENDSHFDHRFSHTFNVGLTYVFGQQETVKETVQEIVPAPKPSRNYMVFFDWDSYKLSERAVHIVESAATASRTLHVTKIDVNGYSDNTSQYGGTRGKEYNQKLSIVRAEKVADILVKNGVSPMEIVIKGYGQENPLIPTAPNTREAHNRRVEIILH